MSSRGEDRRGRPVARERPVRHQRPARRPRRAPPRRVLPNASASACANRLATSRSWCVADGSVRLGEADEVGRHQPRALVDQLVEGVLAVGARLAPHDRAGVDVDRRARRGRPTCRCSPCRAAGGTPGSGAGAGVRQHRVRLRAEEVGVPDAEQAQQHGQVRARAARCGSARRSRGSRRGTREAVGPDGDHQRQADRRVDRVAAADPVPEPEHVGGVDAELRDLARRWSTPRRSAWRPRPRRRARRRSQRRARAGVGQRLERA